jgi:hypothetical protein
MKNSGIWREVVPKIPNMAVGMLESGIAKFWSEGAHFLPIQNTRLGGLIRAKFVPVKILANRARYFGCENNRVAIISRSRSLIIHLVIMNDFS